MTSHCHLMPGLMLVGRLNKVILKYMKIILIQGVPTPREEMVTSTTGLIEHHFSVRRYKLLSAADLDEHHFS